VVPIVREAHERMDGLGYPQGIHAAEVSIGARIVSVADAYDTMTRPRVFRDAITRPKPFWNWNAAAARSSIHWW
jgi:HD-GYP domain-containing protein (c-di-GMP phosphodiesterase class II)